MNKFTLLKLYRAIGLSYLKTKSYNSAIAIFAHYIEVLCQKRKKNPNNKKVSDELKIAQKIMVEYLNPPVKTRFNDNGSNKPFVNQFFKGNFFERNNDEDEQDFNFLTGKREEKNPEKDYQFYAGNFRLFIEYAEKKQDISLELILVCLKQLSILKQYDITLEISDYAKKLYPDNIFIDYINAEADFNLENFDSAIKKYKKIMEKNPKEISIYNHIGNIYVSKYEKTNDKKELKQALKYFDKACEALPITEHLFNAILASERLNELEHAKHLYEKILKLNSDNEILQAYSSFCFRIKDFENYKKYVDCRLKAQDYIPKYYPYINKPMWDCKKDISDKTLLVCVEQGYGDIFMFARSLHEVKDKAKKVIFVTREKTVKLFKYNFPELEILASEKTSPNSIDFDYHVPIMSLIKLWDFSKPQKSYLDVDPKDVRMYRINHVDQRAFNIGLMYSSYVHDVFSKRNIPTEKFKMFSTLKDAKMYSLSVDQKILEEQEKYNMIPLGRDFRDFYDTAVAIKCMHLIISTDNVILNLAGALGQKTFALFNDDIRVGQMGDPEYDGITWYNSAVPFKVAKANEWDKLLIRVKKETEKYRISLREKYLLGCIEKLKNDKTKTERDILTPISLFTSTLYDETFDLKYIDKYIEVQNKLLEYTPDNPVQLGNIATYLGFHLGKKKEAQAIWKKILPNLTDPDLLFNYGCFEMLCGNFDEFFKYYDKRFEKRREPTPYPKFSQPEWKGETDVSDKTLLVQYEQGFGDTILFSRYLDDVKQLFKEVTVVVQNSMKSLIQESFPDINVCTESLKLPVTDYHIPMMSLITVLKRHPADYKDKKWIKANKDKVKEFKKYFDKDKYNIGVFWDSKKTNIERYSDLETFMPLAYLDNVKLYSLHVDKEDIEVNYLDDNVEIVNIGKYFEDFSDTAAAIENCDLVITTDSVILNIAGAMGKKTFGLFNQFPEFRWYKLDGENVGWYKTVKPFQAKERNNYKPVMKDICNEVVNLVKKDKRFTK